MIRLALDIPESGHRSGVRAASILLLILFSIVSFTSCSRVPLYSIDMKYVPSEANNASTTKVKNVVFTVAKFRDARETDNKMVIGKVIKSDGTHIPVLPKFELPAEAVTKAFRDFLRESGYTVSPGMPDWNLNDDTISKEWGNIVIGGTINALEVNCHKATTIKKYNAHLKLTAVIANVRTSKTDYTINVESSPSLEHIRFSEDKIEEIMNDALRAAIQKIFDNDKIKNKISEVVEKNN